MRSILKAPVVGETFKTERQLALIEQDMETHGTVYKPKPGGRHDRSKRK